tara:strand:- start:1263 stop:2990 length:1728 start_codon:yes stop_codon:yes gene_type:complete
VTLQRLLETMHDTLNEQGAKLEAYRGTNAHLNGRNVQLMAELEAMREGSVASRLLAEFVRAWSATDRTALEGLLVESCPLRTNGRWWVPPSTSAERDGARGSLLAEEDDDDGGLDSVWGLELGGADGNDNGNGNGAAATAAQISSQQYTTARPWLEALFANQLAMHWEPALHFASRGGWALVEFELRGATSASASRGRDADSDSAAPPTWASAVSAKAGVVVDEMPQHMGLLLRVDVARGAICELRQIIAHAGFDLRTMALEQMRHTETLRPTAAQLALRARWETETILKEEKARVEAAAAEAAAARRAERAEEKAAKALRAHQVGRGTPSIDDDDDDGDEEEEEYNSEDDDESALFRRKPKKKGTPKTEKRRALAGELNASAAEMDTDDEDVKAALAAAAAAATMGSASSSADGGGSANIAANIAAATTKAAATAVTSTVGAAKAMGTAVTSTVGAVGNKLASIIAGGRQRVGSSEREMFDAGFGLDRSDGDEDGSTGERGAAVEEEKKKKGGEEEEEEEEEGTYHGGGFKDDGEGSYHDDTSSSSDEGEEDEIILGGGGVSSTTSGSSSNPFD